MNRSPISILHGLPNLLRILISRGGGGWGESLKIFRKLFPLDMSINASVGFRNRLQILKMKHLNITGR